MKFFKKIKFENVEFFGYWNVEYFFIVLIIWIYSIKIVKILYSFVYVVIKFFVLNIDI